MISINIPELKLGKLKAKVPIIQGGMAVKVSTAPLAAAVANEGGIGLIAGTGMTTGELSTQIKKAKKMSSGIIGVNIMVAITKFKELVKTSVREKIDLIVSGAGFSRDIFKITRENDIEYVPVVSSLKLAQISEKLGASAVIVEGKEAGGHLGTDQPLKKLIKNIQNKVDIPVIAAGGIVNGQKFAEMLQLGADGVQMGSRFVLSEECQVADDFKQTYLNSKKEDNILIDSPVGLTGRIIKNMFSKALELGKINSAEDCDYLCLKKCSRSFCIMKALNAARRGNMKRGLVFAGEKTHLIEKIKPVKDIINDIIYEAKNILDN